MEAIEYWKYFNCISSLQASELLQDFNASSYPHLKDEKRKKIFSAVKRLIDKAVNKSGGKLASYSEMMSRLQGSKADGRR